MVGGFLRMKPGERLKAAREQEVMTQKDLADATGITASYVTKLESGAALPAYETALALAEALSRKFHLYGIDGSSPGGTVGENSVAS